MRVRTCVKFPETQSPNSWYFQTETEQDYRTAGRQGDRTFTGILEYRSDPVL